MPTQEVDAPAVEEQVESHVSPISPRNHCERLYIHAKFGLVLSLLEDLHMTHFPKLPKIDIL